MKNTTESVDFETIIKKAVAEGYQAGLNQAEQQVKNTYKATEHRLYAYPDIKELIEQEKAYLKDLQDYGLRRHSQDILRFRKSGSRLKPEDMLEAIIQDYIAKIAASQHEIDVIDRALEGLKTDQYFRIIELRYFKQMGREEVGIEMNCDTSTVWRNQKRLVQRMAVRLYGVYAYKDGLSK